MLGAREHLRAGSARVGVARRASEGGADGRLRVGVPRGAPTDDKHRLEPRLVRPGDDAGSRPAALGGFMRDVFTRAGGDGRGTPAAHETRDVGCALRVGLGPILMEAPRRTPFRAPRVGFQQPFSAHTRYSSPTRRAASWTSAPRLWTGGQWIDSATRTQPVSEPRVTVS